MESTEQNSKNQWSRNLENLKTIYDNHVKKSKKPLTNKQIIQKLNIQNIKADGILFREFLQNYSKTEQLSAKSSFSQVQSFFNLLNKNYQQIERSYLQHSSQNVQKIEHQKDKDQKDKNEQKFFQQNKSALSKFIKDENQFFHNSLKQNFLQNSDEGIPGTQVLNFLKTLFQNNKHIKLYKSDKNYFDQTNLTQKLENLVKRYAEQTKQMSSNEVKLQDILINQEVILDFLTFWLQSQTEQQTQLFIIYARTQNILHQLENQYKQTLTLKKQLKIQKAQDQIKQKSNNQKIEKQKIQVKNEQVQTEKKQLQEKQLKVNLNEIISGQQINVNLLLDRYRQTGIQGSLEKSVIKSRIISKQQKLQKIIPLLFTQACKNRTKMLKGTTFDEIQDQLKTMNIQKFINFCTDFEIHKVISRQILIENFKNNAINRLTLDLSRFGILLKRVIEKHPEVMDLLLKNQKSLKISLTKNKLRRIVTDRQYCLSNYNYKLRSVNGKDIGSIEEDLKEKKELKQMMKKQKRSLILNKKQAIMSKLNNPNEKKLVVQKNTISQSKMSFLNSDQTPQYLPRSQPRNYSEKFNPQSLISNICGEDKYWEEYESKIWRKDNSRNNTFITNQIDRKSTFNESILESALSKRIQKGNKVLSKMNSSNLKYYL